ncbi:hypothetical protein MMPV_002172 [Pyropia vietnamensis]
MAVPAAAANFVAVTVLGGVLLWPAADGNRREGRKLSLSLGGGADDFVGPPAGDGGDSSLAFAGSDGVLDDGGGVDGNSNSHSDVGGNDEPSPPSKEAAATVGAAWGLSPPPSLPAGGSGTSPVVDPVPFGTRVGVALGTGVVAAMLGARAVFLSRTRLVSLRHHPATGVVRAYTYRPSGRAGLMLAAEAPAGGVGVEHAALRRASEVATRLQWQAARDAGGGRTLRPTAADRTVPAADRAAAVLTLAMDVGAAGTRAFTVDVLACEVFEAQRLAALAVDMPKNERGGT